LTKVRPPRGLAIKRGPIVIKVRALSDQYHTLDTPFALCGYPYEVPEEVFGMNDRGQIVGVTIDPASGRVVGYVATLPK
jgi:hypothetical protein